MVHFDETLLETHIIASEVKREARKLKSDTLLLYDCDLQSKLKDLLLALECIDLTTLCSDDSYCNVVRLCYRAQNPLSEAIVSKLKLDHHITTGAVCVYPLRIIDCRTYFNRIYSKIPIASVVSAFPSGLSPVSTTLKDIKYSAESGANEIDIAINRSLVLSNNWHKLFDEIKIISEHCKKYKLHLKVILGCGDLGSLDNVYKASMCAMMAGADFIKTSTGKESINAKLVFGLVMIRAIADFFAATGVRVGLKPAGGIKNTNDVLCWINLVRNHLGSEWLTNKLFRIGASSLLNSIEATIFQSVFQRNPNVLELTF